MRLNEDIFPIIEARDEEHQNDRIFKAKIILDIFIFCQKECKRAFARVPVIVPEPPGYACILYCSLTTRKKKLVRVPFDDVIISVKKHAQNQQNSKAPQKARQWQPCRRTGTLARVGFSVHTTMIHYDSWLRGTTIILDYHHQCWRMTHSYPSLCLGFHRVVSPW